MTRPHRSPFGSLAWVMCACVSLAGPARVAAQGSCQPEDQCTFSKPNVLLVLDYSSSMRGFEQSPAFFPQGQNVTTRWDAQLEAVSWILGYDDGFFADNMHIALARFGHDPDPDTGGSTLATDVSFPPVTDGFALDVPFDNAEGEFFGCTAASAVAGEVAVLQTTPPPWIASPPTPLDTMGTWTRGALDQAGALIRQTRERHAADDGERSRSYHVILMTDGEWTCADRFGQGCPEDNPVAAAAQLQTEGVQLHVVGFADAAFSPALDELAEAGGTGTAIDATSPSELIDALGAVVDDIRNSVIVPECISALPRVQVIIDGSSSMFAGGAAGDTKWDVARFVLGGNPAAPDPDDPGYVEPIFSRSVQLGDAEVAIEDVVHVSLVAFAGAEEQQQIVGFGPCMRDNLAWAMDPLTSCEEPGCEDPWSGTPSWTYKNSDVDREPPFMQTTRSYVPACNSGGDQRCLGTTPNTFTGQGLEFAVAAIDAYRAEPAPFYLDGDTRFVNILITDGETSEGSSDVQAVLESMTRDGIDTYVIGFGTEAELDEAQLEQYAGWGGTGSAFIVDTGAGDSAAGLSQTLQQIVADIGLDVCCVLHDCSVEPEPPDPPPVCGDGRLQGDEECDDANRVSGDGCDARCRIQAPVADAGMDGGGGQAPPVSSPDASIEVDPLPPDAMIADEPPLSSSDDVPPAPPADDRAGPGGSGGAMSTRGPVDAGMPDVGSAPADASGCGCRVPGLAASRNPEAPLAFGWSLVALALLRVLSGRRRRRDRRCRTGRARCGTPRRFDSR